MAVSVLRPPQPSAHFSAYPLPLAFSIGVFSPAEPIRKRTTSFSCPDPSSSPPPRKRLHRTESIVDLTTLSRHPLPVVATPATLPYHRTLKYYKEQKDRRKSPIRRDNPSPSVTQTRSTAQVAPLTPTPPLRLVPTSPLARGDGTSRALVLPTPAASCLACGPAHPPPANARPRTKAKAQADLHRRALTACMRESPEGAKILRMGARLAVEIMSATMELEKLCGDDMLSDEDAMGEIDVDLDDEDAATVETMFESDDIDMEDAQPARAETPEPEPVMSASWVVIAGQQPLSCGREITREYGQREDWEMVVVECVA